MDELGSFLGTIHGIWKFPDLIHANTV